MATIFGYSIALLIDLSTRMILCELDQRIVKKQNLGAPALIAANRTESFEFFRVDRREVEDCFGAVVEDYEFDESDRNVRGSLDRLSIGDLLLDESD